MKINTTEEHGSMIDFNNPDFRALFEQAPPLCVVVTPDLDFRILAATNTYLRATLTTREEILGKKFFDIFPDNPDDPETNGSGDIRSSFERVLKSRTSDRIDIQKYDVPRPAHLGGGYEVKYWSPHHLPILDTNGNCEAIMQHVEDVTDTARLRLQGVEQDKIIQGFALARKSIENERRNLRNLFTQTPEFFCILKGPFHLFDFVNDAHIKLLGFDATGTTVREAQPESIEIHGLLDEVYSTGNTAKLLEIPITVKDRIRFFDLTFAVSRDEANFINGVMILGTEVTDQVSARENLRVSKVKLEKAILARDEFLSIASHELRTPLTSMKLQNQMFSRNLVKNLEDTLTPAKITRLVSMMDKGVNTLTRLVEDMLDISRIRTGKLSLDCKEIQLDTVLVDILEHLRPQLVKANIDLKINISDAVVCKIDRLRMEQVFTNLTTNVIRYAPGAPLSVDLKRANESVIITFKDHGLGISIEDAETVFHKFERLVSANEVSGLGLGLYICRQIVEGHGGRIRVKEDGYSGAQFVIELPIH